MKPIESFTRAAAAFGLIMATAALVILTAAFVIAWRAGSGEITLHLDHFGEQVIESVLLAVGVFALGFGFSRYLDALRAPKKE